MSTPNDHNGEQPPQDGGYPPPGYGRPDYPQGGGYPPPEYGQPYEPMPQWAPNSEMYGMPPQRSGPNGMAIAGLALGVVGLFLFNIVLGPLAVIFGAVGLNRTQRGASGRGMAIAGIALGVFDVVIWIVAVAVIRHLGHTP